MVGEKLGDVGAGPSSEGWKELSDATRESEETAASVKSDTEAKTPQEVFESTEGRMDDMSDFEIAVLADSDEWASKDVVDEAKRIAKERGIDYSMDEKAYRRLIARAEQMVQRDPALESQEEEASGKRFEHTVAPPPTFGADPDAEKASKSERIASAPIYEGDDIDKEKVPPLPDRDTFPDTYDNLTPRPAKVTSSEAAPAEPSADESDNEPSSDEEGDNHENDEPEFKIPDNGEQIVGGNLDKRSYERMRSDLAKKIYDAQGKDLREARKNMSAPRKFADWLWKSGIKRGLLVSVSKYYAEKEAGRQLEASLKAQGLSTGPEAEKSASKPAGRIERLLFKSGFIGGATAQALRKSVGTHLDANLLRARMAAARGETSGEVDEKATAIQRIGKLLSGSEKLHKIDGLEAELAIKDGKLVGEGAEKVKLNDLMQQMVNALNGAETEDARAEMLKNFGESIQEQAAAWSEAGILKGAEASFFLGGQAENGEATPSQFMKLIENLAATEAADDQVSQYIEKFSLYRAENLNTEGSRHESLERKTLIDSAAARLTERFGYPISAVAGGLIGYFGSSQGKTLVRGALAVTGIGTVPAAMVAGGAIGAIKGIVGSKAAVRDQLRKRMAGEGIADANDSPELDDAAYYEKVLEGAKDKALDPDSGELKAEYVQSLKDKMAKGDSVNAQELTALIRHFSSSYDSLDGPNADAVRDDAKELLGMAMVLQERMDKGYWSAMSYMGRGDISRKQADLKTTITELYDKLVGTNEEGAPQNTEAAEWLEEYVKSQNDEESEAWQDFQKSSRGKVRLERGKYVWGRIWRSAAIGGAAAAASTVVQGVMSGQSPEEIAQRMIHTPQAVDVDSASETAGNATSDATETAAGAADVDALDNDVADTDNLTVGRVEDLDGDGLYEFTYTDTEGASHTIEDLDFSSPNAIQESFQRLEDAGFTVDTEEIGQNFAEGSTVSVEEYLSSNPDQVVNITSREWPGGVTIGSPVAVDIDGDGIPDQYDIAITSDSGVDVDSLDFAVTANGTTGGSAILLDIEDGKVTIPAGSGLVDANGNFAGRFGEVVENNGGALRVYSTIEGNGVSQITTFDRYPTYAVTISNGTTTMSFETPGAVADHDWEAVGNVQDLSNSAVVTQIDHEGNVVGTEARVYDIKEARGYSRQTDPFFETGKQSPNTFGASAFDAADDPVDVMNDYVAQVSESPEQLELLRSSLGMEDSASTVEELNEFANRFENMTEAEQLLRAEETRDALIERLQGGTIVVDELADSPATASSYITSGADGSTILHTYHSSAPQTIGHTLDAFAADGTHIFDSPQLRRIFGIDADALGHFELRLECGYQVVWCPDYLEVENYVPTPTTTTTTTSEPPTTTPPTTTTDEPDDPDEPDNPDNPDTPDTPDEPDNPDNPGTVPKGSNTHAGDDHEQLGTTPTTEEHEAETGTETIEGTADNHVNPSTAPGSEVNYEDQDVAADDDTAFDQADADTATSEETTSQYDTNTDAWQGESSASGETVTSDAAEGSVNTGNNYTDYSQSESADIFQNIQNEDAARVSAGDGGGGSSAPAPEPSPAPAPEPAPAPAPEPAAPVVPEPTPAPEPTVSEPATEAVADTTAGGEANAG